MPLVIENELLASKQASLAPAGSRTTSKTNGPAGWKNPSVREGWREALNVPLGPFFRPAVSTPEQRVRRHRCSTSPRVQASRKCPIVRAGHFVGSNSECRFGSDCIVLGESDAPPPRVNYMLLKSTQTRPSWTCLASEAMTGEHWTS